ncbi:MAG: acyl carrier protein [Phycisphaerales bacterium]
MTNQANRGGVSQQFLDEVREVAADVLSVPVASLAGSSSPDTVENWDSVQHLSLIMSLEQRFSVSFDPSDVEKARTLEQIATLIAAKRAR